MGKFVIDSSITFAARVLQIVLGLGASIVIARILGPQGQGIYFLAILLPSLLVTFGAFGISRASVFYMGKKKYFPEEILANNFLLSFLLGIIGFLVGLVIMSFFNRSLFPGVAKTYLFLALFLVPLQLFFHFVNHLLLGLQKIKEFNLIKIFQSVMFLILLSVFLLVFKFGIKAAITANILSYLTGATVLFYLAKKGSNAFRLKFNKTYVKDVFNYGFKVYLGNAIGFLHLRIDVFLINIFLNPLAVGFYSIAAGLAEKIWLISQSTGIMLFLKVSLEKDKRKLKEFTPIVCRNILLITGTGAILLFFLSRLLVVFFYSEKFLDSILPFQILLLGAVSMSGWRILANDFYGRGRPEINIYLNFLSVMLNIILNIFWIPMFGIAGAAWATSVSYTFALAVAAIAYAKISGNNIWGITLPQKSDIYFYRNLAARVISAMSSLKSKK